MTNKPECAHEETIYDGENDCYRCAQCYQVTAVRCEACGGEGIVEEDEYECDWVNFGPDLITCPDCHGKGWLSHRIYG